MVYNRIVSADGLTGSRSVVPDLSGRPAMEVENEEFLIPNSLKDINSSPREGTVRWGRRLLGILRPLLEWVQGLRPYKQGLQSDF